MIIKICSEFNIKLCLFCEGGAYRFCAMQNWYKAIKDLSIKENSRDLIAKKYLSFIDKLKLNSSYTVNSIYVITIIKEYFPEYLDIFNKIDLLK